MTSGFLFFPDKNASHAPSKFLIVMILLYVRLNVFILLTLKNMTYVAPPSSPSVLLKTKVAYTLWFAILQDFSRIHRFTLGGKIESYFLELLECIFIALYLPPTQKIAQLTVAISKLDGVKFFLQLAWENKYIPPKKYIELSEQLNEIGRMLGGWIKSTKER